MPHVSWTQHNGNVGGSGTSHTVTLSITPRTGNAIAVCVFWKNDVTISSVTDPKSNTYSDSGAGRIARPTDGYIQIFRAVNIAGGNPGGTSFTITINFSGATVDTDAYAVELIGVDTTTPIGQTANGTATSGTTVTTGTFTPTNTDGAILAFWTGDSGGTALVDPIAGQTPLMVRAQANWGTGIEMLTFRSSLGSNITAQGEFASGVTKAVILAVEFKAASAAYATQTTPSISGTKIAINGVTQPILYGVSYFDGQRWWLEDVAAASKANMRVLRVLLDNTSTGVAGESTIFTSTGTIKVSEAARIHGLIQTADAYGLLVELCILVADSDPNSADTIPVAANRATAVTNAANEYEQHVNLIWDVCNEHNYGAEFDDVATELDPLTDAFAAATSGELWTVSGAFGLADASYLMNDDLDTVRTSEVDALIARGINIFTIHCGREENWYSRLEIRARRLRAYLPANMPLYFSEEARDGSVEGGLPVTAWKHRQAAMAAKRGEVAIYIMHNNKNFDMEAASMISQLSADEADAFNTMAGIAPGEADRSRLRPRPFSPGLAR